MRDVGNSQSSNASEGSTNEPATRTIRHNRLYHAVNPGGAVNPWRRGLQSSSRLIKQRDRPRVRPHVGKIAAEVNGVVGCQDGIDWPGGKPEFGIRKRRRLAAQLGNSHAIARESEQPAGSREPINLAGMCVHKICIS